MVPRKIILSSTCYDCDDWSLKPTEIYPDSTKDLNVQQAVEDLWRHAIRDGHTLTVSITMIGGTS